MAVAPAVRLTAGHSLCSGLTAGPPVASLTVWAPAGLPGSGPPAVYLTVWALVVLPGCGPPAVSHGESCILFPYLIDL